MAESVLSHSSVALVVITFLVLFSAALFYRAALPRPIPGIPHNKHAARSVFGDLPDAFTWLIKHNAILSWPTEQCRIHDSPVVQCFLRPFKKPWIIVCDARETHDILVRRSHEFDRGDFWSDVLGSLIPSHQLPLPTGDEWRAHKRLASDVMSVSFLHEETAHQLYAASRLVLAVWREKSRLAEGRPFSVSHDVSEGILDGIWGAMFGSRSGVTEEQVRNLSGLKTIALPTGQDEPANFASWKGHHEFTAILDLSASVEWAVKSPFPRITHWLALHTIPSLVQAATHKNQLLTRELNSATETLLSRDNNPGVPRRAIDLILDREIGMATKDGRDPILNSQAVRDEILGYFIGGHETTSTVVWWALRFLTEHQTVQNQLRAALRKHYGDAISQQTDPTVQEIVKADIAYYDAFIEEVLRLAGTAPAHMRKTVVDTEILGYTVPKDTQVYLMMNGPGFLQTPLSIPEDKRSPSSRDTKDRSHPWNPLDIGSFKPERWLQLDDTGDLKFDPRSGPNLPFGAGPRSCWGRKLALLQLKILLTLVIWNFELQRLPERFAPIRGVDRFTHVPDHCLIRIAEVGHLRE